VSPGPAGGWRSGSVCGPKYRQLTGNEPNYLKREMMETERDFDVRKLRTYSMFSVGWPCEPTHERMKMQSAYFSILEGVDMNFEDRIWVVG
jgi:hypothetical protein